MLKKIPQLEITLSPISANPNEVVEYVNLYIDSNACENLTIDISHMNVLDASYVSTLCSTAHFIKYPNGRLNWKIFSEQIKEFNKYMKSFKPKKQ